MNRNEVAKVGFSDDAVYEELNYGQVGRELFGYFSRLAGAADRERKEFTLSHFGIHWPAIDEDLSFQGFFDE